MNNEFSVNDKDIYDKVINLDIDFKIINGMQRIYLDKKDVTDLIRKEEVSIFTPSFANNLNIKSAIRVIQKKFVDNGDVVIEGRDIGTRIAPNANYKFYLYCSLEERARRIYNEKKDKENVTYEGIYNDIDARDRKDINDGNFIKPKNAIEIDTTKLSRNEILDIMLLNIKER